MGSELRPGLTAGPGGGWADIAARLPGDVTAIDVDGGVSLTRGAWLCSSDGVDIDTRWAGCATSSAVKAAS